ncbi:MAG: potassium transporter TrkG [Sphingomonadales bacterium]|jgi:trk system potassium uptake protein TrkH
MALRAAAYIIGWFFAILSLGHALPFMVALSHGEYEAILGFSESFLILGFISGILLLSFRTSQLVHNRKVTLTVLISFMLIGPMGAGLPFLTLGLQDSLWAAYFEGVSGLTTNGASALGSQDTLAVSIRVWRIMIEWIGGLSLLVMAAVILPLFGIGGASYVAINLPHGEGESLLDRLRSSFHRLGQTYASITLAFAVGLWISGLPFLDGLTFSMTAISTGGYTLRADGLTAFNNAFAEALIAAALITGALNLTLIRGAARGRVTALYEDQETRTFLKVVLFATLLLIIFSFFGASYSEYGYGSHLWNQIFLGLSILTTSGISSAYTESVNLDTLILLFGLSVLGGSMISTTGGIKMMRFHLLARFADKELARLAHPHGVLSVQYRFSRVSTKDILGVWSLFMGFIILAAIGSFMFAAYKLPFITSIGGSIAMLSGTGPFINIADPDFVGFAQMDTGALVGAVALMIAGRMEILLLLVPLFRVLNKKR